MRTWFEIRLDPKWDERFRELYFDYLEAGAGEIPGDVCARMARDDVEREQLAEFVNERMPSGY